MTGDMLTVPLIRTRATALAELGDIAGYNIPYLIMNDIMPRYHKHMSAHEINKAADAVWELVGHMDQFITDYEPFKLVKTNKVATEKILWGLLYGIREVSEMIRPVMPATAEKIKILVGAKEEDGALVFYSKVPAEPLFMRKE